MSGSSNPWPEDSYLSSGLGILRRMNLISGHVGCSGWNHKGNMAQGGKASSAASMISGPTSPVLTPCNPGYGFPLPPQ